MAYSKIKKILFILLCCFIIVFPFWCVRGLCADEEEEEVTPITVNGLSISTSRNYFDTGSSVAYVEMETGYKYIVHNSSVNNRQIAVSNTVPALNGTYNFLYTLESGGMYEYIPYDSNYLYLDWSVGSSVTVTRIKLSSMNGAVSDLVNNVSINSMFGIFENSIPYILIAVTVAFGLYIVIKSLKGGSKGKGGV